MGPPRYIVSLRYALSPLILIACASPPNNASPPSAPVAVDVPPAPSSSGPLAQSPPPNAERFHEPPAPTDAPDGTPAPPPTGYIGGIPPFNRSAAAAALSGAQIQRCVLPGGPTGMGHVTIVFDPNGTVGAVTIDQPPYAGTPSGGCLAHVYGTITIPPYSGAPVRIGKSFNWP